MSNGSSSVRYSKARGWFVDVSEYVDGKRRRTIKTFGKGDAAKQAAKNFEADNQRLTARGQYITQQVATFADLWRKFEAWTQSRVLQGNLRASTAADYLAIGKLYLLPRFGETRLLDMTRESVDSYQQHLLTAPGAKSKRGKPLASRTVAKIMIALSTVFGYGIEIDMAYKNPALAGKALLKRPTAAKREVYILSPEEIARLRAAIPVVWQRLMIELMIVTGLRSGEARGLIWDNMDLTGARLHVRQSASGRHEIGKPKTESSFRTVGIPAHLIPELKRWKLACPLSAAGLVFPGKQVGDDCRALNADELLRRVFRPALRKAGIPAHIRVHDLRHNAQSYGHETGASAKRQQDMLGHASLRMTEHYTHALSRGRDDIVDQIASKMGLSTVSEPSGDIWETFGDAESAKDVQVADVVGSPGWNRTNDQRINSSLPPEPTGVKRKKTKT